jgi:hypothetical protein
MTSLSQAHVRYNTVRHPHTRDSSTNNNGPQQSAPWWVTSRSRVVILLLGIIATVEVVRYVKIHQEMFFLYEHNDRDRDMTFGMPSVWSSVSSLSCDQATTGRATATATSLTQESQKRTTIAYATSITAYDPTDSDHKLIDRAAVLHQSIRLASQKSHRYDYHMYAFVHPDAGGCAPILRNLGYRVQIRDTPFNESMIANPDLATAQRNGCCGAKVCLT